MARQSYARIYGNSEPGEVQVAYGTIRPGCVAEYSTYTMHPWIFREMHSSCRMNVNGNLQARKSTSVCSCDLRLHEVNWFTA